MATKSRRLTDADREAIVLKRYTLHKVGDRLVTTRQMGFTCRASGNKAIGPHTEIEVLEVSLPRDEKVFWHYGLYVTPADPSHAYHGQRFYVGGEEILHLKPP